MATHEAFCIHRLSAKELPRMHALLSVFGDAPAVALYSKLGRRSISRCLPGVEPRAAWRLAATGEAAGPLPD